ncbi:MAG TPA: deoxyribose-phosphate aldolase [Acidimicrobiales bacterium]|nr:deoxyribose-phosphate aldolase [Acidimicrobiales bacterium]
MRLDDKAYAELLEVRVREPSRIALALTGRRRRPTLAPDGMLFIVAADHTARGMLGAGGDALAMVDRRRILERLALALEHARVDGVLASADILEDLVVLGLLDDKVAVGTMNRGGLSGARWELDDRMTAYDVQHLAAAHLDGGKMLLRLDDDDPATVTTLETCARTVTELADHGLMAMVEPLPYTRDTQCRAVLDHDPIKLLRVVVVSSGLAGTSAHTWLKILASADIGRVASATTLPLLLLGGPIGADPPATFAAWERGLQEPAVRGLVAGRALLYPPDGDVVAAIDATGALVQRAAEARR